VPGSNVRVMDGKELFARVRDDLPGLRALPGGPLPVAQPSRVDDIRAARFDAYRKRAMAARTGEVDRAAAGVARRGRAAVAEALRNGRKAS
jgi:hypothetical protein